MQQIVISDGFYSDPEQMRVLFSTMEYTKNSNFIQGQIGPMSFSNDEMIRQMEYLINVPQESYEFSEGSGTFILNQETDSPTLPVCVNFPDLSTQWIGIVCLSKPKEPHFLKFYRHKRTGWEGIPDSKEELSGENIYNYEDFQKFLVDENDELEEKWQETTCLELGFNKLILFRPGMFHSYSDVYGDSNQTGRLLQFFFLRPKVKESK